MAAYRLAPVCDSRGCPPQSRFLVSPALCHCGGRIFLCSERANNIAAPEQNIQQSRTFQVVQKHFTHADIERPPGAFIRGLNLFSSRQARSRAGLPECVRPIQELITAVAKMIQTKSFLTKGNNDRPRATAPI